MGKMPCSAHAGNKYSIFELPFRSDLLGSLSVVYKQPGYALTRALPFGPSLPLRSNEVMEKTLTITTLLGLAISTSAFARSQVEPTDALPSNANNAKVVAQTG
jgi:hypothetical protein